MKPIVTLTLNPSIDGAAEAAEVKPIHKVRTTRERYDPGGGGVNVARVTRELGGQALAVYCAGGATGSIFDQLMKEREIPSRRVDIADHTRIAHTVFETKTGLEYRFVPEGPALTPQECEAVFATLAPLDFDYLVASGSLPRGAPADFYVRVGALARDRGARFVLDTSGAALKASMEACGVHLAKPSLGEFEALAGRKLEGPEAQEAAAADFVARGC
ncbi:MAG TPA: PfkB family carbohydrate kinase, partial [Beijerinckiaceae bacterium]